MPPPLGGNQIKEVHQLITASGAIKPQNITMTHFWRRRTRPSAPVHVASEVPRRFVIVAVIAMISARAHGTQAGWFGEYLRGGCTIDTWNWTCDSDVFGNTYVAISGQMKSGSGNIMTTITGDGTELGQLYTQLLMPARTFKQKILVSSCPTKVEMGWYSCAL